MLLDLACSTELCRAWRPNQPQGRIRMAAAAAGVAPVAQTQARTGGDRARVSFQTEPGRYRHWRLAIDGPVATLAMDVAEGGGLRDGYELKLNSYDLGADIELYDAVQRLR